MRYEQINIRIRPAAKQAIAERATELGKSQRCYILDLIAADVNDFSALNSASANDDDTADVD